MDVLEKRASFEMRWRVRPCCKGDASQQAEAVLLCSEEGVFRQTGVDVIGVSPDAVEKQKKFVEKHDLPVRPPCALRCLLMVRDSRSSQYPILSDKEGLARKSYNVNRGLLGLTASSGHRKRSQRLSLKRALRQGHIPRR